MKFSNAFLAALLCCMILLGGCSRPAADTPASPEDPSPSVQEETDSASGKSENKIDAEPSKQEDEAKEPAESDDSEIKDDKEDADTPSDDPAANASQGRYKLFDSGFEINVQSPFVVYYDPLVSNMTVTIPDDPSCRGYIFYDTSEQSLTQLEESVKNLEPSVEEDPTITDLKTEVDQQDNGLFSFTFSYSAGATEGSPAGFYFVHYQKTENGVINVNLFTERSSNSDVIRKLIDSIQPVTESAVEYGK